MARKKQIYNEEDRIGEITEKYNKLSYEKKNKVLAVKRKMYEFVFDKLFKLHVDNFPKDNPTYKKLQKKEQSLNLHTMEIKRQLGILAVTEGVNRPKTRRKK